VVITVPVAFLIYAPLEHRQLAATAGSTATYTSNMYFAVRATDHLGGDARANPLLHTWSLSVEEQFYLVWPVIVLLALGTKRALAQEDGRSRLLQWMIAAAVISFAASLFLTRLRQPWAFFLAPTRAWEFALGAIGVLFAGGAGLRWQQTLGRMTCWIGLGAILVSGWAFDEATVFPGIAALLPAVGTVLVIRGTAEGTNGLAKLLSLRPLQEIGRLSYSWYLWHWPVLVIAAALYGNLPFSVRIALLGTSLLLAQASYSLVENPIRHSRRLARARWGSLVMAGAIAGVGIILSVGWWRLSVRLSHVPPQQRFAEARLDMPVIYDNGCHVSVYEVRVPDCEFGTEGASQTVVLLGDSHAAQWFPALEQISRVRGWRLVAMTKSSCPAVDGPEVRVLNRLNVECSIWRRHALERIGEMRPALVVISSLATGYGFTDGEWLQGTRRILAELSSVSGRVVLVRDTPSPGFDVPVCLARQAWRSGLLPSRPCTFQPATGVWADAFAAQQQAAAGFENVRTVDLLGFICPAGRCPLEGHGYVYYRDWHHLTKRFSESRAEPLAAEIGRGSATQLRTSDH
jgi:peptidoglycan/LPS O-acetylase OafA/YrhL